MHSDSSRPAPFSIPVKLLACLTVLLFAAIAGFHGGGMKVEQAQAAPNPTPVLMGGTTYSSLQSAYTAAVNGSILQLQAIAYPEGLLLNRGVTVSMQGGYDAVFSPTIIGTTILNGPLIISTGRLTVAKIVIKSSAATFLVPNVVGMSMSAAQATLVNSTFTVGITSASHVSIPQNIVISQVPAGGVSTVSGSLINLVVSTGPPPPVSVPDVVGLSQIAAESAVTGVGLTVGTVTQMTSATVPSGTVISQNPTSGTMVSSGSAINLLVSSGPPPPVIVQLNVTAGSTTGSVSYHWRATDGSITDVNAPTTTWILPDGPGLHFAYVLVGNGVGGYTERRIAVNTDTIGNPAVSFAPRTLAAPAAAVLPGQYHRDFLNVGSSGTQNVYLVDQPVFMQDPVNGLRFPPTGAIKTNLKGEFVVPGVQLPPAVPFGLLVLSYLCSLDNGATFVDCGVPFWPSAQSIATTEYTHYIDSNNPVGVFIVGTVFLADGSICGTSNKFFEVEATATASLLDTFGNILVGPVRADSFGGYALQALPGGVSVILKCEGSPTATLPVPAGAETNGADLGTTLLAGTSIPTVSTMTATRSGSSVGLFLPPPSRFPSDTVPSPDHFLDYKGLDSRLGACQYYKSVGAVHDCDPKGNFIGAVHLDDWKRAVKIGPYATPGPAEYSATYINQVDLNLTRNHHSISYGPNQTAAYVCNHLGPSSLNPAQAEIDQVIDNALAGKNLVACVMMDYAVSPGVNGDLPYTRYLIFGPSGELLPSINLDGRREKFVPGTCVVCHGGDHYAGKFPEDGSGAANIGANFLPYDSGNFAFSSKPGLTETDQSLALYHLNQYVLNAGPNVPMQELITGWYGGGTVPNKSYVPASWQPQGTLAQNFYTNVYARSCRTCHISMVEGYNFDHYQNLIGSTFADTGSYDFWLSVCGSVGQIRRLHSMPNSLVTFNRFWLSAGTTSDQVSLLQQFMLSLKPSFTCPPVVTP